MRAHKYRENLNDLPMANCTMKKFRLTMTGESQGPLKRQLCPCLVTLPTREAPSNAEPAFSNEPAWPQGCRVEEEFCRLLQP